MKTLRICLLLLALTVPAFGQERPNTGGTGGGGGGAVTATNLYQLVGQPVPGLPLIFDGNTNIVSTNTLNTPLTIASAGITPSSSGSLYVGANDGAANPGYLYLGTGSINPLFWNYFTSLSVSNIYTPDSLTVGGNVGIGSSSGTQKLAVTGQSGGTGTSGSDFTGGIRIRFSTGYGMSMDTWDAGSPKWGIARFASGDAGLMIMEGDYFTQNTYFMAGRIGIGTTNPAAKLDVVGAMNVWSNANFFGGAVEFGAVTNILIAGVTNVTTATASGNSNLVNAIQTAAGGVTYQTISTNGNITFNTETNYALVTSRILMQNWQITTNTSGDLALSNSLGANLAKYNLNTNGSFSTVTANGIPAAWSSNGWYSLAGRASPIVLSADSNIVVSAATYWTNYDTYNGNWHGPLQIVCWGSTLTNVAYCGTTNPITGASFRLNGYVGQPTNGMVFTLPYATSVVFSNGTVAGGWHWSYAQ